MKLWELLTELPYVEETRGDMNTEIRELTSSSREKTNAGLFFCIVGARFDAHDYAWEAVENGCVALIVEHFVEMDIPQVLVNNGRAAMARIADAFYGHPSRQMRMIGITGTKGKTTTTYLLQLRRSQEPADRGRDRGLRRHRGRGRQERRHGPL